MRIVAIAILAACTSGAHAQEAKPAISIDEVMEKSIQALGGREAMSKMTSLTAKGTLELSSMGITAATELYSKSPDKRYSLTVVEGYGEIRNGYDGKSGWSSEPQNGLVDLKGDQLARAKRDAQFNGELRWKELYPKAEVTGKEKVGGKDCWVVKLTPAEGKPIVRYIDTESFLAVKALTQADSPDGEVEVPVEFSDWKDIGNGVKAPHTVKVTMPGIGELVMRYKEYQYNVEIDDGKFAKPKN